jgi:hypothetical protein
MVFCESCNKEISKSNWSHHLKSSRHLNKKERNITTEKNTNKGEEEEKEEKEEFEDNTDENSFVYVDKEDLEEIEDDFLSNLNSDTYKNEIQRNKELDEKERKMKVEERDLKQQEKIKRVNENLLKKNEKVDKKNENEMELLGKDKRLILAKISQYKNLFKDELKNIKINNGWELEKLNRCLDEIEIILQIDTVDSFILDAVFQSILVIEGVSSNFSSFNIQGLAGILRTNPKFISLCKQIFVKYGCYLRSPPEVQLLFIVSTSAFICIQKNKNRGNLNSMLNEKI